MATDKGKINADLDKAMAQLLKDATANPKKGADGVLPAPMSLTDKMKIIDRVLKWEAIKAKLGDEEYGSGFKTSE